MEAEYRLGLTRASGVEAVAKLEPLLSDPMFLETIVKTKVGAIANTQPHYIDYITQTGFRLAHMLDPLTFFTAFVEGYEMIPPHEQHDSLTFDEMGAAQKSIDEYVTEEEDGNSVKLTVNFVGLSQKIKEDSPEFAEWLNEHINAMESGKIETTLGILLAIAPFYFRAETRRLSAQLANFGIE